jgi:hypothetical protein
MGSGIMQIEQRRRSKKREGISGNNSLSKGRVFYKFKMKGVVD